MICKSMDQKKELILGKINLEYVPILNEDVKVLSNILIARVSRFVEYHIPRNQQKLCPGVHWVWDSLKYLLPKLCAVIILSGHTVSSRGLLLRTRTESLLKDILHIQEATEPVNELDGN